MLAQHKMTQKMKNPMPPIANQVLEKTEHHGDLRIDPYSWLQDKKSQQVVKYLNLENQYTDDMMKASDKFQSVL